MRAWMVLLIVLIACAPPRPTAALSERERAAFAADAGLERVALGMTTSEVLAITGPPTSYNTQITGLAWIPGNVVDTHRTVYRYRGRGRVWFANHNALPPSTVIRVEHDPEEQG